MSMKPPVTGHEEILVQDKLPLDLHSLLDDITFTLPPALEAHEPPEARGLRRDGVRLMVSYRSDDRIAHASFRDLGHFLDPGDLLVLNTSGTRSAALKATRADGTPLELHLSTHLPGDVWVIELRKIGERGSELFHDAAAGETLLLPEGGCATLHLVYPAESRGGTLPRNRLWIASLHVPGGFEDYISRNGFPIRYSHVRESWPISYYQTVYATEAGSAEMPSAGRPFTPELITQLVARGIQFAPVLLHTGVSSPESDEPPYDEFFTVPEHTAWLINAAHPNHKRVIAVGTTVVRALETATDDEGVTHASEGWTRLLVTPRRGIRAVNGLLTGFHEPRSTHLAMLEALAGREHIRIAYRAALEEQYLWHEFGDLHLILP